MGFQALVCCGSLLIAADLASAEEKPTPAYFQPYFSHYFKPVSTFYTQPTVSPYESQLTYPNLYPSISPYYPTEKSEYGTFSLDPPSHHCCFI